MSNKVKTQLRNSHSGLNVLTAPLGFTVPLHDKLRLNKCLETAECSFIHVFIHHLLKMQSLHSYWVPDVTLGTKGEERNLTGSHIAALPAPPVSG